MAYAIFKNITMTLNGWQINPDSNSYAYQEAYLETFLNYN